MMDKTSASKMTLPELVETVRANEASTGGANREALAEISVRSILAQEKSTEAQEKATRSQERATRSLSRSTWLLAVATIALVLVGLFQLIVSLK